MRDDDVPVKTQEGLAEIKNRSLGLAPRIRTALLLVDGVKTVRELEQLLAASGVKPGALQTLLEKKLISLPQQQALDVPTIAPATAPVKEQAAPQAKPSPGIGQLQLPKPAPAPVAKAEAAPKPAPGPNVAPASAPAAKAAPLPKAPAPAPAAPPVSRVAPAPATPPPRAPAAPAVPTVTLAPIDFPQDREEDDDEAQDPPQFIAPPPPEDMKLVIARAHMANALDDRVEGYVLRQMVAHCSSRAELESLFDAAEYVLKKSMGSAHSARVLGIAKALLHS